MLALLNHLRTQKGPLTSVYHEACPCRSSHHHLILVT